jgi:hypothetical protein
LPGYYPWYKPLYYITDIPDYYAVDFGKVETQVSNVVRLRVTDTIVAVSPVLVTSDFVTIPAEAVIETTATWILLVCTR